MKLMESALRAVLGLALLATAGCATQGRHALDAADRSPSGGREAVVMVPQAEIRAEVVASNVGAATGGGLLGALIDVGVNQHRTKNAEKSITPLRNALVDYSFDKEALATTQETLTKLDWLKVQRAAAFSKDSSKENDNAILDKSASPEVLFVSYTYEVTADFSAMEVTAQFTISPKAAPRGQSADARLSVQNAAYTQQILYFVPLAGAGTDPDENCKHWSDKNAAAARAALGRGLSGLNGLAQRALAQSEGDVKKLEQGPKGEAAGRKGKLIEKNAEGTLILDILGNWVFQAEQPVG
jgi:hypothetical protein